MHFCLSQNSSVLDPSIVAEVLDTMTIQWQQSGPVGIRHAQLTAAQMTYLRSEVAKRRNMRMSSTPAGQDRDTTFGGGRAARPAKTGNPLLQNVLQRISAAARSSTTDVKTRAIQAASAGKRVGAKLQPNRPSFAMAAADTMRERVTTTAQEATRDFVRWVVAARGNTTDVLTPTLADYVQKQQEAIAAGADPRIVQGISFELPESRIVADAEKRLIDSVMRGARSK